MLNCKTGVPLHSECDRVYAATYSIAKDTQTEREREREREAELPEAKYMYIETSVAYCDGIAGKCTDNCTEPMCISCPRAMRNARSLALTRLSSCVSRRFRTDQRSLL